MAGNTDEIIYVGCIPAVGLYLLCRNEIHSENWNTRNMHDFVKFTNLPFHISVTIFLGKENGLNACFSPYCINHYVVFLDYIFHLKYNKVLCCADIHSVRRIVGVLVDHNDRLQMGMIWLAMCLTVRRNQTESLVTNEYVIF